MTAPQPNRPELDPRIARLKWRLLSAPYELCMARALHFTRAYRQSEGQDPALRNARALARCLARQAIAIAPDEWLAGSKTERFLAGPLSVERGDFLRAVQLELPIMHRKRRPFVVDAFAERAFRQEVLPYWRGRTVRDAKARGWQRRGLIDTGFRPLAAPRRLLGALRFGRYLGRAGAAKLLGANRDGPFGPGRLRDLFELRHELARNNPTPAVFCFDVQGHLSLGVDRVIARGMQAIAAEARARRAALDPAAPGAERSRAFLLAAAESLEAAMAYAERFAALAEKRAADSPPGAERSRLERMAAACRRVPRHQPETFQQAVQAVWMTLLVGEIQYGTHEVFAVGRLDQVLWPHYVRDRDAGRLDRAEAVALLQELFLKLSANVEPIPEIGMETNSVLGNSQHVVTIGGQTPAGADAANELSLLMLEAHEGLGGCIDQLSVRVAPQSAPALLERAVEVCGRANGIAFYNDQAVIAGLLADGYSEAEARDYCIVGCIETSGQSNTHGCPGGHELTLPAVLLLALSRGRTPPPAPGQQRGFDSGDPGRFATFEDLLAAFRRQLGHQVEVLLAAVEEKDRAWRELLPAPYVSALMDGCLERARDITAGGARYDFTSIAVRGLATLIDSLLALDELVYRQRRLSLSELLAILDRDFAGHEALRQRIRLRLPKYGRGEERADRLAYEVIGWIAALVSGRRNLRGGRYRVCYYSYGNHVIDGLLLGATPDGRRRGEPISNGVSAANGLPAPAGALGPLRSAAGIDPARASCGVSLNLRFHPRMLRGPAGVERFSAMLRAYFRQGGMHLQPNLVSTETLRAAQADPRAHADLVVKVAGYSAYFTDLGRSIQDDIIAREEFG